MRAFVLPLLATLGACATEHQRTSHEQKLIAIYCGRIKPISAEETRAAIEYGRWQMIDCEKEYPRVWP